MHSINGSSLNRRFNKAIPPNDTRAMPSLISTGSAVKQPMRFGSPSSLNNRNTAFPFSKKEMLFGILYLLGSFAGISKLITGSWPLQALTPHAFEGHSGWPANTTVLAPGGQDVYHMISNKWGGKTQRYIDNLVAEMGKPSTRGIHEAHARLSESGFRNFYLQTIYPTASSNLPFEMKDGQLLPGQCQDTFRKTDDPATQHIILVEGKDASLQKVESMFREQFPLIPPKQITVLKNPDKKQLGQSLSAIRQAIAHQSEDSTKKPPQLLFYYQGHGGVYNRSDKRAPEGSYLGAVLLADGPADEQWFAAEMGQFPDSVAKTLIFDSCQAGSFIQV